MVESDLWEARAWAAVSRISGEESWRQPTRASQALGLGSAPSLRMASLRASRLLAFSCLRFHQSMGIYDVAGGLVRAGPG